MVEADWKLRRDDVPGEILSVRGGLREIRDIVRDVLARHDLTARHTLADERTKIDRQPAWPAVRLAYKPSVQPQSG